MAVAYPYTSEAQITSLAGQLAVDLRTGDSEQAGTYAADIAFAIEQATNRLDFYLSRYAQADIAASSWAQDHATWFAVRALCQRRLNDVPAAVQAELKERIDNELEPIRARKGVAPRLPLSRRPGAVTNYTTDLRRFNNQDRVDANKSTGPTAGYNRPIDDQSPDQR